MKSLNLIPICEEKMEKTLKNLMISMFFGSLFSVGIAPYVITSILKDLNASVLQMAFVPFLAQCGGCLGLPLVFALGRMDTKKSAILMFLLSRSFMLLLVLLLLLSVFYAATGPVAVLLLYGVSMALGVSGMGPANSWFKCILPGRIQGTFLGRRNALGCLTVAVLTPVFGYAIDCRPTGGVGTEVFYSLLLILPLAAGYFDIYFLNKVESAVKSKVRDRNDADTGCGYRDFFNPEIWKAAVVPLISLSGILLLSPFLIILYYEMGMSGFTAGLSIAFSTLGLAGGMVFGGRFSDRSRKYIRHIFTFCPIFNVIFTIALGVITFLAFSGHIRSGYCAGFVITCLFLMMATQGIIQSAQTKYIFDTVKGGRVFSFSLVLFLQNLLMMLIFGASIKLGGVALAWTSGHKVFPYEGFHYLHILFFVSAAAGIASALFLRKFRIYGRG